MEGFLRGIVKSIYGTLKETPCIHMGKGVYEELEINWKVFVLLTQ